MARISGVEIPTNKRVDIALTYIYGLGHSLSKRVLKEAGIDESLQVNKLSEDDISRISIIIDKHYMVEGALRRQTSQNIQRLKDISSYRGLRHRRGLPLRGQRTRTNARTRKGPRKVVAGKKVSLTKT